MSEAPRIAPRPIPTITTEQVREVRARAWAFVFVCFHRLKKKKGGPATAPDARKEINGSGKPILPK